MSNICGSVDVVRERERQARLQLLDEYRDPSPQPIFSQPVKVELEDETSRRIKDTLGDFTQVQHVLINDPKHLIGISRSGAAVNTAAAAAAAATAIVPSTSATSSGRYSSVEQGGSSSSTWSSTRNVSGSSHPSSNSHSSNRGVPGSSTKRPVPVNGLHKPPTNAFDVTGSRRPHHPSSKPASGSEAKKNHHHHHPGPSKHHRVDPTQKANPVSAKYNTLPDQKSAPRDSGHKDHRRTKSSGGGGSVPAIASGSSATATQNGSTNNAAKCATPPPPPLQKCTLPNGIVRKRTTEPNIKRTQAKFAIPRLSIPPQGDRSDTSHFVVESILKEMKQAVPPPLTAIQTPRTEERGFTFASEIKKDNSPLIKVNHRELVVSDDEVVPLVSPVKKSPPAAVSPFNLQEDLEMSDSDDDEDMVPSCKNPELAELAPCPRSSPLDESAAIRPAVVETGIESCEKMEKNAHKEFPAHTSSSESSDSDSSGSDSDSHSETSDTEAPEKPAPQQWGLSNFIVVARRNNSPAFGAMDTNTNSSTTVKEEPPPSVSADKDGFSLADEDSVNRMLSARYSDGDMKDYLHSSMDDIFMMKNGIKSDVLSPIQSPVHSPVLHQPVLRGPRTPPEEPEHVKESPKRDLSESETDKPRLPKTRKQSSKSPVKSSESKVRNAEREDRHSRSKRKSTVKQRKGSPNHIKSKNNHRKESSASKELVEPSKDTHSRPVPSADTSRATHRTSHRKHSSAAVKRHNSQTETNKKSFPDNASEPSTKSKNPEHHPESVFFRGNSKGSSTAKSSEDLTKVGLEKTELQNKHSHKSREQSKSGHKSKSKSSSGKKSSKGMPKSDSRLPETSDSKRPPEKQKKSSKFSIKNFLQSPLPTCVEPQIACSPCNSTPDKQSPPKVADSPDITPRLEEAMDFDEGNRISSRSFNREAKHRKLSTSTSPSRSRSGSRTSKPKENSKKVVFNNKKPSSKSSDGKRRHKGNPTSVQESESVASEPPNSVEFSKSLFASQQSLPDSRSLVPSVKIDCAIPSVMVCIPLSKILRLPGQHSSKLPKNLTEDISSKDVLDNLSVSSCERSVSTSHSVSPSPRKDFKARHRTESTKAHTTIGSNEKPSKSLKPECVAQRGISPSVCDKSSIECDDRLTKPPKGGDNLSKKRKSDKSDTEYMKKKPKLSSSQPSPKSSDSIIQMKMKDKIPVVKIERMEKSDLYPASEKKTTPKRRDSTSSMSSLCSQQSHKSSKANKERTKENLKDGQESKKPKLVKSGALLTTKDIKKEKEDKPKLSVKKELSGAVVKPEKCKSKSKERTVEKIAPSEKKVNMVLPMESHNTSSQMNVWDGMCKAEDSKVQLAQQCAADYNNQDAGSDWEHFAPDIHQELKQLPNHHNKVAVPGPMIYYYTEGKKLKYLAAKEADPIQQALKYFEATVMFVLTSLHRELSNKEPDSIYQMYKETLKFTHVIRSGIQKHQSHSMAGSTDFKILILCLKCQSLLYLKLYGLKIKEVKEQHKGVTDFMHSSATRPGPHSSPQSTANAPRNLSQPSPCQPRIGGPGSVPSPHSPTPSPAGSVASVGSQSSGYSSSELNANPPRPHSSLQLPHMPPHGVVAVPQSMFDVMAKHHLHLSNLHMCHELWEQADMYMTRSNSKEFFKEVAEKSEKLSLHSTIKELVNYLQTGLSMLKDC